MELLAFAFGLFVLVTFFLPWFHHHRLKALEQRLDKLAETIATLAATQQVPAPVKSAEAAPEPEAPPAAPQPAASKIPEVVYTHEEVANPAPQPPVQAAARLAEEGNRRDSFELNFGAKLPVWIGGIALAFAGFYLVRYTLDNDLLGPGMQVVLGLLFGLGLIAAAYRIGPQQVQIGQSLAGAGIAILYCALFVASNIYHVISPLTCLIAMSGVTAGAVIMAIRHGPPIAIMGMLGGFLTPVMTGSHDGNIPLLLTYVYVLFTALFWFIRRAQWWGLLILLTPLGLLWAVIVLFFMAKASEVVFVSLFLLALCVTVIKGLRDIPAEASVPAFNVKTGTMGQYINYAIMGFAAVLIGIATARSGYGFMERGLLMLLTAGTIALAAFNRKDFGFAPWLALVVNMSVIDSWRLAVAEERMLTIGLLAALYGGAGSWLVWKTPARTYWALLSSTGFGALYLLAYFCERTGYDVMGLAALARLQVWPYISLPFWGLLALLLASVMVRQARRANSLATHEDERQKLLAIFTTAATGFLTLALGIELQRDFLPVAFAAEMAVLAYLSTRLEVKALRTLALVMALLFALVLIPQLLLVFSLAFFALFELRLPLLESMPFLRWPLFQLGVPALLFAASSLWLRRRKDDRLVRGFEIAAVALFGLMGYYLMRHIFTPDNTALYRDISFIERGFITNILFVFGLACLWLGERYQRIAVAQAALVLVFTGLFRTFWFDFLVHNPLFSREQNVGDALLLNGITLTYGLPVLWLHLALRFAETRRCQRALRALQMLLAFAFISFTVRQFYHGGTLTGMAGNVETYTYSAVWLLFGVGLLVHGTRQDNRTMRIASLAMVTLTVGKVFLIDADELQGLWRVASFLGLGGALLGISWFYNRFIFKRDA